MAIRLLASFLVIAGCVSRADNAISDQELARLLADPSTRGNAVIAVAASGQSKVPLLLSWSRTPPPGVSEYQLYIGLADAFGELRSKEAIPFLIKNINLSRTDKLNTWMKTASVIERELPAVAALIRIGPDAGAAVIRMAWGSMTVQDRVAMVFVVSRIKDFPEAANFLGASMAYAHMEASWAAEGLRALGIQPASTCQQ